ncbi:MAG: DUF4178 domain-containing protein [Myxococcales bacterium]|nr:DUF4178 domain-containing protein [Myxococcales bacterium]
MTAIYLILVLLGLAGGGFWLYRSKTQRALPAPERAKQLAARVSALGLQIGDIVVHYDKEYIVEGKLIYDEEGWTWLEFMLVDGDDVVWLSAEEDDQLELAMSREIDDLMLEAPPGANLTYNGVSYRQREKGRARVTREGQTGKKSEAVCTYFEYVAGGDKPSLSIEQWGQSFDAYLQTAIRESELDILPAS